MTVEPAPSSLDADRESIPLDIAGRAAEADLPTGEEKTALVRSMFDAIAPRYDLVNRLMTFGLDIRWRKQSVGLLPCPSDHGSSTLPAGRATSSGSFGVEGLASIGIDLSWGMLAANRTGGPLAQADVSALPVADSSVDGITCGYALRNFTDLRSAFGELGRVVRPGGRISLLEVAEPEHGLLLVGHRTWFRHVVPVIGGLLSDSAAYRYLPKSTAYLPPTAELRSMLQDAGFSSVNRHALTGGLSQLITATRAGRP